MTDLLRAYNAFTVRCKACHYSLQNLTGPPHRCPECGRAFDPNNTETYISGELVREWIALPLAMLLLVAVLCIVVPVLLYYAAIDFEGLW